MSTSKSERKVFEVVPFNAWRRLLYRNAHCQLCLRNFRKRERVPGDLVCKACWATVSKCDFCEEQVPVSVTPGMTAYDTQEQGWENPNRVLFLCPECAEEHVSHWTDMWNEYYRSIF